MCTINMVRISQWINNVVYVITRMKTMIEIEGSNNNLNISFL